MKQSISSNLIFRIYEIFIDEFTFIIFLDAEMGDASTLLQSVMV